jgi:hypothetical protein
VDEVDRRWEAYRRRNPRAFDGPPWHVLGVHRNGCGGAVIHVIETTYRFYAVQGQDFGGMCGLGVRGITRERTGVLLGRRADGVAHYPGLWELAPAGSLEPGRDPARMVAIELREETGLDGLGPPRPIAILFDPLARAWEIVHRIDVAAGRPLCAGPPGLAASTPPGVTRRGSLPDRASRGRA